MKFFNSNECPEEIDPEEPEDTCSHGNLLGECDICDEDEDVIEENPDEIEEQNSASERRNTMPINLNYEKLHRLTKNI